MHGGSWQARYRKWMMRALAADLLARGWAVWNVEYRRVGEGEDGGWPATFADVAAAVDHLPDVDAPLDLACAVVVGFSAGGQLALWVAGTRARGPGGSPRVSLRAAVSLAGVNDMTGAHAGDRGGPVHAVMGGSPDEVPERYDAVDPVRQVPLRAPTLLVHGTEDATVPIRRSRDYARAARAAGDAVDLVEIGGPAGEHRRHLDPRGECWTAAATWLGKRFP